MKKTYLLTFFIIFTLVHALIQLFFSWQSRQLNRYYKHETEILHSNVAERFSLLMDSHRAIGIVASETLSTGLKTEEYQRLSESVMNNYDELIGLNVVNDKGIIVQVAPTDENAVALGKVTQNAKAIRESAKKLEPYWLSPPFSLFQGMDGFAFYLPIYSNNKIAGWVVPVIGQEKFFKKFIDSKFLESYHLIIQDQETGKYYFSTGKLPAKQKDLFKNTMPVWGRTITFYSWPRVRNTLKLNNLLLSIFFSLLAATFGTFFYWILEQKIKTKKRLESLNGLLKLTVQDTGQGLLSIQHQLNHLRLGNSSIQLDRINRHVNYISTLIRQIEVLQRLSGNIDATEFQKTTILPMLLDITEMLNEQMNAKKLVLTYDPQEMNRIEILADKWLICHSVFSHFIKQAIKLSPIGADIHFEHSRANNFWVFSITHTGVRFNENLVNGKVTDEENFVAEKVINLHRGQLYFKNNEMGGTVFIKLPVA